MKKIQKGFTLIELLIVIAIIGILAGVILVSTSSARSKANIAAFKSEVKGSIPGLMMKCDTAVLVAADMPNTVNHDTTTITAGGAATECGPSGSGAFVVTVTPTKADVKTACGNTVIITPSGVFASAGVQLPATCL